MLLGSHSSSSPSSSSSLCHCENCQYPPPRSLAEFRCLLQWSPVEPENGFASSVTEHNQINGHINMQADDGNGLYGEAATYMHDRHNPPLVADGCGYGINIICTNMNSAFKHKMIFSVYLSPKNTSKLLKTEGNVLVITGGCVRFHKQQPLVLALQVDRQLSEGKCTIVNARLHLKEDDFTKFCQTIN